ncbi:MAG: hypothetical protein N2318_00540 [Meiothermus sp.]|nr:hypothetical protein [Meiothermus sp.]
MDWTQNLLSNTISAILGGLVVTIYTAWITKTQEVRRMKFETLRKLAATRYMLTSSFKEPPDAFLQALNEVYIVFNDAPKVVKALNSFHQDVLTQRINDESIKSHLLELFTEMYRHLRVRHHGLRDSFLVEPFTRK